MTLRSRFILGYILLVAVSLYFVMYLIMNDVRPRYLEALEDNTVDTAELLAAILARQMDGDAIRLDDVRKAMQAVEERSLSAKIYNALKTSVNLRVYVTDKNGILLYDSTGSSPPGTDYSRWRDVYLTLRGGYGARTTRLDPDNPASSTIYVAAPILKNGVVAGVVTVGKHQDSVSFFIAIARNKLRLVLLLIGLTTIGLGIALSAWITWPIKRLISYVHTVRQGKSTPLPSLGGSEIGALGEAIQEMQSRLEGKEYIEEYVRALTHELKSPLTGIRGAAEILREHVAGPQAEKFLNNIESEAERLQSLVDRMLRLSRLENVRELAAASIDMAELFREIQDLVQPRLAARRLRLDFAPGVSGACKGDRLLLRQAIENLLANAADFSPEGKSITLGARTEGEALIITVQDQGTGMPEYALARAFEKFFSLSRPDSGKKSTGLGLAFVKEVVTLHQGRITVANTSPGLLVTITLPLEQR
ncbi:two-component system sensor histidine kinase CreC [Desulfovibrio sp. OttesenSCG-928-A18]|nr:two-component system sensor histidine kinase CreC [Desulfovibrio sp. OttesenSCG-928-A18]